MESIKRNLIEGLVRNSLNDLILSNLSIDEYESKISDKRAIVVGFFVEEELPARDLSNFIDRSNHPVFDTEVSPAPTPDGYFMVFVEIERDEKFPKTLIEILNDVENLTNIEKWTFQSPRNEEGTDLSAESLIDALVLDQNEIIEKSDEPEDGPELSVPEPDDKPDTKDLAEFWKNACVDSFLLENDRLILNHFGIKHQFEIIGSIPEDVAIIPDDQNARILQHMVGPAYGVFATDQGLIVENGPEQRLIRSLDR